MSSSPNHAAYLQLAVDEAVRSVESGEGAPFGAVVVDTTDDTIVYAGHNELFLSNDPTAHAEVTVIRRACEKRGSFRLTDCVLYTSCYPCPMCLCACLWAEIKQVYYAATPEIAAEFDFHDKEFYDFFAQRDEKRCKLESIDITDVRKPFETWEKKADKKTY